MRKKNKLLREENADFLADMSHKIRIPINTIMGMNEMILRENKDEEIQKFAVEIYKAGTQLLTMLDEMLDYSELADGSLHLENFAYDLGSLLNDVIHDMNRQAEEKKLKIVLNIEENLPVQLKGDKSRIKQVLNHLISNAVKFTEKGRITFTVQGRWSADDTFYLIFSLADTGIGLRQEELVQLFGRKGTAGGTRSGLSMAKMLVDKMKGELFVQSVYQKGSLFTVTLPQEVLNKEKLGNLQNAFEQEVKDIGQYRELFQAPEACILAVDDNQMNLQVVKSLLKNTQVQLELVQGGAEALERTRHKKYQLILLDHMMPQPDGVRVLHMLREEMDNPNAGTPVIALTANAAAGMREWYKKEGFDDYLSKPIAAEKLEAMIKTYLPKELITIAKVMEEEEDMKFIGVEEISAGCPVVNGEACEEVNALLLVDPGVGMGYCMNDEVLYYDILQSYHEQGERYIERMTEAYEKMNWKELAIIVHAIKSTSLNIGSVEMSQLAKAMEQYALNEDSARIQNQWQELIALYMQVLQQVEALLRQRGIAQEVPQEVFTQEERSAARKIVPKEEYMAECRTLLEYVKAYAMQEAMAQLEKLAGLESAAAVGNVEDMLHRVGRAVEEFSYDEAEDILREWLEIPQTEESV